MTQPYVGEIRMFGGNFAPLGWMFCAGQLLPISQYETLFNLIGTTYGGDGQSTFALPDLQGRAPMHMGSSLGNSVVIAQNGGVETVTLTQQQIPGHLHQLLAVDSGSAQTPQNNIPAAPTGSISGLETYAPPGGTLVNLSASMLQASGGGQPHENLQPFLCISFIISLSGIFPSAT